MSITRRDITLSGIALATTTVTMFQTPFSFAGTSNLAKNVTRAARSLLATLSFKNRAKAVLRFEHPDREDWHYTPRSRPGATLSEMSASERAALWDFLGETLSARGIAQAHGAIKLERVLGELTNNLSFRDPDNYAIVFFGDPATADIFAWRFEGHHLSVTAMVAKGHGIAVTPSFVGANPATVPDHHSHAGFRLLGAEEDRAFALIRSLEGEAHSQAIINNRSLGDIVAGPGREDALKDFEGVPLTRLNDGQRDGIYHILGLYAGTMRDEIATSAITRIRADGTAGLYFAWAGSLEPGQPHYFRIHGPSVLVEYDNTQGGGNHVHSSWIDPKELFGRDLLKAHHRQAHSAQ